MLPGADVERGRALRIANDLHASKHRILSSGLKANDATSGS